jgi:hypothetical protein
MYFWEPSAIGWRRRQVARPVSQLGFGRETSIAGIIGNATASGGGLTLDGELTAASRTRLNSALSVDLGDPTRQLPGRISVTLDTGSLIHVTPECYRVISAIQSTNSILTGRSFNLPGIFITSWKAVGNSNPDASRFYQFPAIGTTAFYGFRIAGF